MNRLKQTLTLPAATAALALGLAAPASAQSDWTGAVDNDWAEDGNWNPAIEPGALDPVTVNSGSVVWSGGNITRNAATEFNGSSDFTITGGRFIHAQNTNSTITFDWNSTGTFDHTGNFFLVGQRLGTGVFNQTAGTVNANITDVDAGQFGFYLSDSNAPPGSQGVYNLTGGTLNVTFNQPAATRNGLFALGRSQNTVDTSINGGHDLFVVDGGDLNLVDNRTAGAREFQVLRDAKFQLDSGTVSIDTVIMRIGDTNNGSNATIEINDGTFTADLDVAMNLGQNGSNVGTLVMNGGTLDVVNGELWVSNAGNGLVNHNDGDITVAEDLVIAREVLGSTRTGYTSIYNMFDGTLDALNIRFGKNGGTTSDGTAEFNLYGGSVTADDILLAAAGSGTSTFNFFGGTLTLDGDRTSILGESWFNSVAGTQALFDSNSNTTTVSLIPEPASAVLLGLGSVLIMGRSRRTANAR